MNSQVKQRWVKALRSGEYEQGRSALRSSSNGFCCLGVLCDVYAQDHDVEWEKDGFDLYTFDHANEYLPDSVRIWAELNDVNPSVSHKNHIICLSDLNDTGRTFDQIANIIEEQL